MIERIPIGARKRVLACDDEPNTLRLIEACMQHRGWEVKRASTGLQALIRLRNEHFNLAILDVVMPDMDGLEVLRHIRADDELKDLPVILVTANAKDADVLTGYRTGADLYLTKPFNPGELVEFARRIAEERP